MTKAKVCALVVGLLLTWPRLAQTQGMVDMPVVVEPTQIRIGSETVPRFLDLPNKLIVPSGVVADLPTNQVFDYIEVAGTLRASRTQDTHLSFTHLFILPGGYLDVGTQADPIPCGRTVDLSVRDIPIDTTRDKFQWGNGLLNFGKQTRVGCKKTDFVEATGTLLAGSSSFTLASPLVGAQVGDELLIPDTGAPDPHAYTVKRETALFITAINGNAITVSHPLEFTHANLVDPNGVIRLHPIVANLTRNIIIRSENPNGTPGHTADLSNGATWDIRNNVFIGLGRTKALTLNDFNASTGLAGTNQRGRYAEHHHHVQSCPTCADVGNVYRGNSVTASVKWGLALHDTSDMLVQDSIAIDFAGAGFVTEDGYEVRNTFRHLLAAYTLGDNTGARGGDIAEVNVLRNNNPGGEGTGFWFRGVMNTFDQLYALNNFTSGVNFFNQAQPAGSYPSVPGGMPDTILKHAVDRPLSVTNLVLASNIVQGLEIWALPRTPLVNLVVVNNGYVQIDAFNSDRIDVSLVNPTVVCAPGIGGHGIKSSMGYVGTYDQTDGYVGGCPTGVEGGGGSAGMTIKNATFQNEINFDMLTRSTTLDNVHFLPLGTAKHQYVIGTTETPWPGPPAPLPDAGLSVNIPARGSTWFLKNYSATPGAPPKDYTLFRPESLGSNPSRYSGGNVDIFNCPVVGLTNQQCWDTYGISFGGDVLDPSQAVSLDGFVGILAREGLTPTPLGPPRAVCPFPNLRRPVQLENGTNARISCMLTGDYNAASDVMMFSIDGGDYVAIGPKDLLDNRETTTEHIAPGIHTVRVGRTPKASPNDPSTILAGSTTTQQFCVTGCPPETRVIVPRVLGRVEAEAKAVLVSVGLKAGLVGFGNSSNVPAGQVMAEDPGPLTEVPPDTAINLTISQGGGGPTTCIAPQVLVNGVCKDLPPPSCVPPKILLNGVCVDPPPVDVCPNLPGVQATVPAGFTLVNGQCVATPPPPVNTIYTFTCKPDGTCTLIKQP